MKIFDNKLNSVFVKKNDDGRIAFTCKQMDGSWVEMICGLKSGDIDFTSHGQDHKPEGESSADIFRNDHLKESEFVRNITKATRTFIRECVTDSILAVFLLEEFGYRLEEPSEESFGYCDPVSPCGK
ncbi:MAG: hypothetical protein KBD10_00080 [Candidatus Pacebacteria bacterium]|nr:hypothetical protein [Candidatus Paceibacterota bacterium]